VSTATRSGFAPAARSRVTPQARSNIAATLVFAASVLLIVGQAPAWCAAVAFGCALWRIAIGSGWIRAPRPRRGMRFVFGAITALLVVAVALSFRTLSGLAAGTALLVVMGALKLMESRTRRDDGIVIGVALFLLLAAALATQSLWRLPFYLLTAWGACAAIAMVARGNSPTGLAPRAALRLSARALAMSLPLAAACFLLFPRVAGQFWALHRGGQAATGLSDEMAPASIGTLATEYEPAFRVRFEGAMPPREALYFRGPVLNSFDGYTWRRERGRIYVPTPIEMLGEPARYRVTLEPSNRPYLFALDTVLRPPRRDVYLEHDRQLTAMDAVTTVSSYDAVSYLRTRTMGSLSSGGRAIETRLPPNRNPRTLALARALRAESANDADYARRVLEWFRAQGLEYTLDPGTGTAESVDWTLFDSKRGFCAHFASAYATMMRAAGVPARIVTGYLGGEWNAVGGYLLVRQSEAHAWTETWLDGQGWVRIDPTAVVSPERLQRGIYDYLGEGLPVTTTFLRGNSFFTSLSQLWDGANQWWQERVVEFDIRSQLDLLRWLGIDSPTWEHLGYGFAGLLVLWMCWVAATLRRSVPRVKPDRIARAWLAATAKLARVAPARAAHEGPLDYAARVAASRPDLAPTVLAIARHYGRLRYGPKVTRPEIEVLERAVRSLPV
jgi:protein-glutamine gamma-glutamyltransferase